MGRRSPIRQVLARLPDLPADALADLKPVLQRYLREFSRALHDVDRGEEQFVFAARVTTTSDVSISNNVDTAVTFTTTRYDYGGFWSASTPTRLVAPVSGFYLIGASVRWAANATGNRRIAIQKNSANHQALDIAGATSGDHDHTIATGVSLDRDDYLELAVLQTSGGSLLIRQNNDYSPDMWMAHGGFLPEV